MLLDHLPHCKNIFHEAESQNEDLGHNLIWIFHNIRQGKKNQILDKYRASLKVDGRASIHLIHDNFGVGISDKHRFKRGIIARNINDIDKHFGHEPEYADHLKSVFPHTKEIVNAGYHVQGDLLYTQLVHIDKKNDHIEVTPNMITYSIKTGASMGIAVHSEIKGNKSYILYKEALKRSSNIFVPKIEYDDSVCTYSKPDCAAVEKNLKLANKIIQNHTNTYLTPRHKHYFTLYINKTNRTKEKCSINGYMQYLEMVREKHIEKIKSHAGKEKAKRYHFSEIELYLQENLEHFQKSIDLHRYLEDATEHVLNGIQHHDMITSINGEKSQGEGIVLYYNNKPISKLVSKTISNVILNNNRYNKS
jgi:hypothetical protein